MKKELQDKLFEKYNDIFTDRTKPMNETCMCWGVETGDGWFHLIDNLCKELTVIEKEYDIKVIADQVKEKYGSLRFYYHVEFGSRWKISNIWFIKFLNFNLYKLPKCIYFILHRPIKSMYDYFCKRSYKLDGKNKLEYVSLGWTTFGKDMWAGEGVQRLVNEKVNIAENNSYGICEICGMTGATQNEFGWISTLCENCINIEKEKKDIKDAEDEMYKYAVTELVKEIERK